MRWLSSRTNLYQEIYQQPHQLREILRAEIDRCYVETTSESVTSIGRFSDTDRSDTKRPIDQRFLDSLLVDENNDPAGLRECYVIDFEHLESQQKSIDSFLEILKDEELAERIKLLRRIRSWPEVAPQHVEDMEQEHIQKLCQELPDLVIHQEQKSFRLFWRTGQFITSIIPIISSVLETGSYIRDISDEIDNEQVKDVLNKTKIRDRIGELISKERKIALTGILRDWLTKDILTDDRKPQ